MHNLIKILVHRCVGSPFKYSQYDFDKKFMQNFLNFARSHTRGNGYTGKAEEVRLKKV